MFLDLQCSPTRLLASGALFSETESTYCHTWEACEAILDVVPQNFRPRGKSLLDEDEGLGVRKWKLGEGIHPAGLVEIEIETHLGNQVVQRPGALMTR